MIAFEVSVNNERLCVAGIGDDGVLDTSVMYSTRQDAYLPTRLWLHVGGLANEEHLRWIDQKPGMHLNVGDEIRVRIIETDDVDSPPIRFPRRQPSS